MLWLLIAVPAVASLCLLPLPRERARTIARGDA